MGLKGNLSSISLADVFQTLSSGSSSGLLRIQAPEGPRFVELRHGTISIAGRSSGRVMLGDLLIARGLVDDAGLAKALEIHKQTGKILGQVLLESGLVTLEQLEDALRFQVEEEVCELFTLHKGEFDFLEGATLDARIAPAGGVVRLNLQLDKLLAEAAQRAEEWRGFEQRIPSQAFLFQLTPAGTSALEQSENLSSEGRVLLRLVQAHRTVEAIVQKVCLGRFNSNRLLLELWDGGLVEPVPQSEYLAHAREHLRQGRLDEAQRIGELAAESGDQALKGQAQEVLEEINRVRRQLKTPSAMLSVRADGRVRSEVIRRASANLLLRPEHSRWPLVAAGVLLLAGLAVGGYFLCAEYLAHGTVNAYTASHRQLEEANAAAQTLIAEGKYEEGLQQLRAFTTLDPEVRKLANEKFQERQKDVEALLSQAIERFDNAYRGSTPEELKAAAAGLQPLIHMSVHTSLLETRRAQTRIKLDAYLDTQRATQFKQRLNEIENTAGQNHETRLQAYTALLTEDPPEGVAAKVRADADRLAHELQAAARWLRQARKYRDAGDPETAKLFYEKAQEAAPGSAAAVEAGTEREAANAAATAQQAECERIEALPQNKSAEARAALLKFLESKPGPIPTQRALAILQGLQPVQADEMELAAGLKAAKALLDKQPPDVEGARQKTLELADKQPYAKASRAACLKVELTSQPEGANVAVNGKPAGVTTLKADIPVLGFVHLAFSKEGCRTEDLLLNNCRAERLSAVLDRNPAASSRLPVAGQLGLCVEGEQLFVGGFSAAQAAPPEIVACSHPDMKVLQRIKLQKSVQSVPALTVFSGEAFVPTHENTLLAVNLVRGEIHPLDLGAPASSTPVFFTSTDDAGGERQFMGIATQAGYECYQAGAEAWKLLNRTPLAGANKPAPQGMAFDGERCFLPRNDFAVHAVGAQNGKWAWKKALDAELSGPPALFPFVMPGAIRTGAAAVAVATLGGKVAAFDAQGGTEIWRRDKGAAVPAGLASAGSGFLVARCDGTVELLPLNMKGAPLWTVSLMGEPALTPFVLRDKANPQGKAIIICTKAPKEGAPGAAGGTAVLTILAPDSGKVLWRTALEAPIVALAASNERLYVCTADFELTAFDLK